uniref:Uncharacterized protein n=1 Tax=Anguilla anguilla TaxID=7936 RepID=A0A0E9XVR2_ANGAN
MMVDRDTLIHVFGSKSSTNSFIKVIWNNTELYRQQFMNFRTISSSSIEIVFYHVTIICD